MFYKFILYNQYSSKNLFSCVFQGTVIRKQVFGFKSVFRVSLHCVCFCIFDKYYLNILIRYFLRNFILNFFFLTLLCDWHKQPERFDLSFGEAYSWHEY